MHHLLTKLLAALTVMATLCVVAPAPAQAADPAYFVMTDITREEFVVQLTDPGKIQHARDLLSGATSDKPHVIGRIVKRSAPYNPRWSYNLNPDTVSFFDVAIEVCDATIPYVEDHLDEAGGAFLPGLVWCPWTSRLVRELPAP
ncbi:calmodulin-binding protein [Nonomuraea sp. NPDC004580]|uniref:BP74-related protein n=1 Tax=Nonomuraea sp. NPDC004580 TaxID=3154552 RepID=UPI0033BF3977